MNPVISMIWRNLRKNYNPPKNNHRIQFINQIKKEVRQKITLCNIVPKIKCMTRGGSIYIMTNKLKTTLYIGVTADLYARIQEHKQHAYKNSFTDKYNLEYCIYYENFPYIQEAINREKEIKKWRREKKEMLINSLNPKWMDLWEEIKLW